MNTILWPKFSQGRFVEKLRGASTPHGVSCSYLQWTDTVGLKMFSDKHQRDHSHKGQGRAAKIKLAPQVGEMFDIELVACSGHGAPGPRLQTVYCFYTETAKLDQPGCSGTRIEARLKRRLKEIGINHHDTHAGNVGKIGKRTVVIDFDSCSCRIGDAPKAKKAAKKRKYKCGACGKRGHNMRTCEA